MSTVLHLQSGLLMVQHQFQKDGSPCNNEAWKDLCNMGLSLECVFGGIESGAEKARDRAKLCLGEQSLSPKLS